MSDSYFRIERRGRWFWYLIRVHPDADGINVEEMTGISVLGRNHARRKAERLLERDRRGSMLDESFTVPDATTLVIEAAKKRPGRTSRPSSPTPPRRHGDSPDSMTAFLLLEAAFCCKDDPCCCGFWDSEEDE